MATKRRLTVFYRRKRQGRTNYKKRLALLMSGKPRLVIRPSLKNIIAQIVSYRDEGDRVEVSAHSRELKRIGWNYGCGNIPSAYLIGLLVGVKAKKLGIYEAVPDLGLNPSVKHSRIYAAIKGAIDSGLNVRCADKVFPRDDMIRGEFIKTEKPGNICDTFEEVKKKIENGK